MPYATTALIVACAAIAVGERFGQDLGFRLLFVPYFAEEEPYRFLSSAFLHAGFWHILPNMYMLWLLGSILEPLLGTWRFVSIYVLSAVAGNAVVLITADRLSSSWTTVTVGASGAVFGLLGAQLVVARLSGSDLTNLMVVVGLNLVIGFMPNMNISWQSHLGGFIAGLAMMAALVRTRTLGTRARPVADGAVLAGMAVLIVALIVWGFRG
ncbi:MAG: rhomboid family intramembrane serine protease [Actinomycetaceae bacterium]|nr:rhomboid family intramembrane serine protease [Actinomycetaceae bacterium]